MQGTRCKEQEKGNRTGNKEGVVGRKRMFRVAGSSKEGSRTKVQGVRDKEQGDRLFTISVRMKMEKLRMVVNKWHSQK